MIYEDFNGAGPRFYAKFARSLPNRDNLMEQFIACIGDLPNGASVVEIGMGSGSLAELLFQRFPTIGRYVGIEPAADMVASLPSSLITDGRFTAMNQGFEEWEGEPDSADLVVCRYVLHDFPDQLETWYGKIAEVLRPGSILVSLDVTIADEPERTQANLEEVIQLAERVTCEDQAEEAAKVRFISHLREEIDRYRPLGEHVEILRSVGLEPAVLGRSGNNYLLQAKRVTRTA